MGKEQNLQPVRTKNEATQTDKNDAKASGKARRERKQVKDELLALLTDGDTQEKVCSAIISQASQGNTKAFEVIRDTIGEKPVVEIEVNNNINAAIAEIEVLVKSRQKESDGV